MTLHKILPLFLFFTASLALSACQSESATWERVQQSGILRVGLDPTYPPFEVADESGVQGLDVDLAHALADKLGLRSEFVYFGYDGLYDALATEQIDVLISALVTTPERQRDFAYSEPYFNAGEFLFIRSSTAENIQEMRQMSGRSLAVELGSLGHVEAIQWTNRLSDLEVLPFGSAEEALDAVSQGQADAALVDHISGRLFLRDQPQDQPPLIRVDTPITVEPYALVVRIEDEKLLVEFDKALQALKENGQLEDIIARWLDK